MSFFHCKLIFFPTEQKKLKMLQYHKQVIWKSQGVNISQFDLIISLLTPKLVFAWMVYFYMYLYVFVSIHVAYWIVHVFLSTVLC